MSSEKLMILCIGAGAIGSYIGGSLSLDGHEVHFLDRKETLDRIREHGINLHLPNVQKTIRPPFLWTTMQEALIHSRFDFSILAVKSYDTDDLLDSWRGIEKDMPPVLCLQNGVENEEKISRLIGENKTIQGTVTTAIGRILNGIVVEKLRGIGIASTHELSELIIHFFNRAGLNAQAFENGLEMKWSKLLTNVTTNASCAILNMTPREIMEYPALFQIEILQLREVLGVIKSHNLRIVDLPGTPVRLFSMVVNHFPLWLSRIILMQFISKGRGNKMPSFYLDLLSGRKKSEVDYLNGAVVRYGNSKNIPTPTNLILNQTLLSLTAGDISPIEFDHNTGKYLELFR